jgi:predicted TPR repeat methyltransferase
MKKNRYNIRFPSSTPHRLGQDEAYFLLTEHDETKRVRFHSYHDLYEREGLYEQLFYEKLRCRSPHKLAEILKATVSNASERVSELRVLDLGAGNGVMGEVLGHLGLARVVGVDILDAARAACERDRPGAYDAYYVTDLTALSNEMHIELVDWQFSCMTCVAALGFGDIPPAAFAEGFNLIQSNGWIAFNIKETFLQDADRTGFSFLVKNMLFNEIFEVHHLERYCHRLSMDGAPLFYYALVGRKQSDISPKMLTEGRL